MTTAIAPSPRVSNAVLEFEAASQQGFQVGLDSTTGSGGGKTGGVDTTEASKIAIGQKESRKVCVLRMILFTVLLIVAATVSAFVYRYTRLNEQEDFETAFWDQGLKVVEQFQWNAARRMETVENLAVTITSNAISQHMSWPSEYSKE